MSSRYSINTVKIYSLLFIISLFFSAFGFLHAQTTYSINDVASVTSRYVDPIPQAVDDEHTEYTITLENGTIHIVKVYGMSTQAMHEGWFRDTGYVGDIDALTAMAVADDDDLSKYGIDDVESVTSRLVDIVSPSPPFDRQYTEYTITLENGTVHQVSRYDMQLQSNFENNVHATGYVGDVSALIAMAVAEDDEDTSSDKNFSASPTSGDAPLQVSFEAEPNEVSYFGGFRLFYGDGSSTHCGLRAEDWSCSTKTHTYQDEGTYTARLAGVGEGIGSVVTVDTVTITVEGDVRGVQNAFERFQNALNRLINVFSRLFSDDAGFFERIGRQIQNLGYDLFHADTIYRIGDVVSVVSRGFDPTPFVDDDDYTEYTIVQSDGTEHTVKQQGEGLGQMRRQIRDTGYRGNIDDLLDMAIYRIGDVESVTSRGFDPIPDVDEDNYTEYTIKRNDNIEYIATQYRSGLGPTRRQIRASGYRGNIDDLLEMAGYRIGDVASVVSRDIDPTPYANENDTYTEYTITRNNGTQYIVTQQGEGLGPVREQIRLTGYIGSIPNLLDMATNSDEGGDNDIELVATADGLNVQLQVTFDLSQPYAVPNPVRLGNVEWGDGDAEHIDELANSDTVTVITDHAYDSAGTYTITVTDPEFGTTENTVVTLTDTGLGDPPLPRPAPQSNEINFEAKVVQPNGNTVIDWTSDSVVVRNNQQLHFRWNATNYARCLPFLADDGMYSILHSSDTSMITGNTEEIDYEVPVQNATYRIQCAGRQSSDASVHESEIQVRVINND